MGGTTSRTVQDRHAATFWGTGTQFAAAATLGEKGMGIWYFWSW